MVSLTDPQWLQGAFSTLVGLFDRLGLLTNVGNKVGMVFCLFQATGNQSEVEYGRRVTVEGPSYWEQHRRRVQRKDYGEDMLLGFLVGHMRTKHGMVADMRQSWVAMPPAEETRTYWMAFPTAGGPRN